MLSYYEGKTNPALVGLLPQPYYWWEAGAMMGSLVDYWRYTGDTSYVNLTTEALLKQVGDDWNYMPMAQAKQLGNDDQAFWGMAAMAAAEYNFPNPPKDKPQWLALAQAVFTTQASRWDNATCGGGLRWQIFPFNNGYRYKNTISNGCFFNLAARLHAYTGNTTYLRWAKSSWDWTRQIGLVNDQYGYFDGTDVEKRNCSEVDRTRWSYNPAIHMHGFAVLYNTTGDQYWKTHLDRTWQALKVFFTAYEGSKDNKIAYEAACEPDAHCNLDQQSFKAYLARWMAATMKITPHLAEDIRSYIWASAAAAAKSCVGGADGITCGTRWDTGAWDGTDGVGQQMSALEMIQATLIESAPGVVTNHTGGTSTGDYNAGTGADKNPLAPVRPITLGDKAGAGVITAVIAIAWLGGAWWVISHS